MQKIKRNNNIYFDRKRKRKGPLVTIIFIIILAALVFVGYSLFDPISDFVNNISGKIGKSDESSSAVVDVSGDSSSETELSDESSSSEIAENSEPAENNLESGFDYAATLITQDIIKDQTSLDNFILSAKKNGINTAAIVVKNSQGYVMYESKLPDVIAAKAVSTSAVDLAPVIAKLKENGIKAVAVMSAFKDSVAPAKFREGAVSYKENVSWLWYDNSPDKGGKPWLNPNSETARSYLINIASECADLGFSDVLMYNVQFPDGLGLNLAQFGSMANGKAKVLSDFVESASQALSAKNALFVLGGEYEKFINNYDFQLGGNLAGLGAAKVAPFIYPQDFKTAMKIGEKTFENPAENVSEIINLICTQSSAGGSAKVMPILSGSTAKEIKDALKDISAQGYILCDKDNLNQ